MLTAQIDGFFGDSVRDTEWGHIKLYCDCFCYFFGRRVAPGGMRRTGKIVEYYRRV